MLNPIVALSRAFRKKDRLESLEQYKEPVTVAKTEQYPLSYMQNAYMARPFERVRQIDIKSFPNYSITDLLDLLRRNHPEVSFAIWQFLRIANSDVTFKAKGVRGNDNEQGQRVLDRLLWQLNHPPSGNRFQAAQGINLITGQLLLNVMLRGAAGLELVLDQTGKLNRLQVFDTNTFYFKSEEGRLVPYQRQSSLRTMDYVNVDYPTVFYEPLDPAANDPYGTNPLVPLCQIIALQIQFLSDLMAAVHSVGYPRVTATLVEEAFRNSLPDNVRNDYKEYVKAANNYLSDIKRTLHNLNPDEYLAAWDTLKMGLLGQGGGGQPIRIDVVMSVVQKSLSAALKTLSSILGIGDNTSKESYSAELKIYSRGIDSIQKVVENILERALTLGLNLEGVRGWVDVEFAPVDLRSELQVVAEMQTRQDIIITARMRGSIDDYEEMTAHRNLLGLIGQPKDWEELIAERNERQENGGNEEYPRHGSPPANQ